MIIDLRNQNSGGGGSDPRVDQLIKDVAKKQDKLNNITEIPDEGIFVGKLNDEGQPIGGVEVAEDGVVQIEASEFGVGKDGELYIYANGEGVGLNGNVTVNDSTVLTEYTVKTINGESIVGEGDIEIKGGGGDIKAGEGIYITEDSEGAKVISISYEIGYKTYNGAVLNPTTTSGFGATIISNTYVGGKGIIKFDGNITTIPNSAYTNASTLTSISIPDSVTSIGNKAFNRCIRLTSVTIPDSVTSIGSDVFTDCSGLTSVVIPDSVKTIGTGTFVRCKKLKEVTLPKSITSIVASTFESCSALTSVIIPDSVTSIASNAFYWCASLSSITIPDSVTSIGYMAFNSCTKLNSITIGKGVTSIIAYAFGGLPTQGTLYCDEDWYNNLDKTNKDRLENINNWTKVWTPKPLDERVDDLDERVTALEEGGGEGGGYQYVNEDTESKQLILGEIPSEGDPMAAIMVDGNSGDVQIFGMQSTSLFGGNVNISNLDETSSISVSDGGVNIVGSANINEAPIVVQENFSYDPSTKTLSINFL